MAKRRDNLDRACRFEPCRKPITAKDKAIQLAGGHWMHRQCYETHWLKVEDLIAAAKREGRHSEPQMNTDERGWRAGS